MIYKDRIYGKFEIKEPVLLELLKAPSVLRLKKISQLGVPDKYYHFVNYTRYEHSAGVMIFLRKLGATLEEQVAGLLHDVSVLAFSHVADWVFGGGKDGVEDYHDKIHKEFVENTEIPRILKKYGFFVDRILNLKNFSLLEREIPDLCADRIDYCFRESNNWQTPGDLKEYFNSLVNFNGEIVFNDKKIAKDFAINFLSLQTNHWGGYEATARYYLFSEALKIAIKNKIISKRDFFKDEDYVLNKIEKSSNKFVKSLLKELETGNPKKRRIGKRVIKKFRYVDPKIIMGKKLARLSEIDSNFKRTLTRHKEENKKGIII